MIYGNDWKTISKEMDRTNRSCCSRMSNLSPVQIEEYKKDIAGEGDNTQSHKRDIHLSGKHRNPWSIEEHNKLVKIVNSEMKNKTESSQKIRWLDVASQLGTRSASCCYDRWWVNFWERLIVIGIAMSI